MVGKIKGTGSYRPVQVWDNDKLSHMMDTSDEWIRGRTGIGQRHIASGGETVAYMAARAAEEALSDARMRPEEIDLLLVSTMSSERIMPCAACEVQKLIGAVNAACFDLNGACTGFLLALNTAQAYLGQQIYRRALVIGSETFPSYKLEGQKYLRIVWRWCRCGGAGSGRKCSLYPGCSFYWKQRRSPYLCQPQSAAIYRKRRRYFFNLHADGWKRSIQICSFQSSGSDYGGSGKGRKNKRRNPLLHASSGK